MSNCTTKSIKQAKDNQTPLSRRSQIKTKSTLSTLDMTIKVPSIPTFSELDTLYQQYLSLKSERKKSQKESSVLIGRVNYIEKEHNATKHEMKQIKRDMLSKEKQQLIRNDSKERQGMIQAQHESCLMKQKEKNAKLKSSIDYIGKTWKDQVRVKHETISNKIRLAKYRNESWRNRTKLDECEAKKEKCMKIKKERAVSVEKRDQLHLEKRQVKKQEIIDKIKSEIEKTYQYEQLIQSYKDKGDEIISRIESLEREKQCLISNSTSDLDA